MQLDALIDFFDHFAPESVARFPEFYAADAYFKDPFNEVRGIPAIQQIFRHMFCQVQEPRFTVTERVADAGGAMLTWDFHFRLRGRREPLLIRGVSHLKFDAAGKINFHRDYWDAAEELYEKLPVLGLLMRGLRKALAA